jgi:hypothetical protein
MYTMGGLMLLLFVLRFFVFHLYESPKYLMGRGRDADAVAVVHKVAAYNGRTSSLTVEMLAEAERAALAAGEKGAPREMDTSARGAVVRKLRAFNGDHVRSLFATRKLAYSTTLLIILWGMFCDWFVAFQY